MSTTITVCKGCCCGHPEKGNPAIKEKLYDELVKGSDIAIDKPYCLGPCHLANVAKVEVDGTEHWFKEINTDDDVKALVAFAKDSSKKDALKEKVMF